MGPLVLPKNSANGCGWANWPHQRNTANGVMWAQCCSRDMLLKAAMGLLVLPKGSANGPGWAQYSSTDMLPKVVNRPIGAAKGFCRWLQMGQLFCL